MISCLPHFNPVWGGAPSLSFWPIFYVNLGNRALKLRGVSEPLQVVTKRVPSTTQMMSSFISPEMYTRNCLLIFWIPLPFIAWVAVGCGGWRGQSYPPPPALPNPTIFQPPPNVPGLRTEIAVKRDFSWHFPKQGVRFPHWHTPSSSSVMVPSSKTFRLVPMCFVWLENSAI